MALKLKDYIILYKKEGETPLEALEFFRKKNPKYRNLKMTYAGRLDPMASGLLLILIGEEVKKKEKYLNLRKEYEFEVLFGFSTDTYDILGLVSDIYKKEITEIELQKVIQKNLKNFKGKFNQKYPLYSSKTVNGKPLFQYGRSGEEVDIPGRQVEVSNLRLINLKKINTQKLLKNIIKRISKVKGDFRQEKIIKAWEKNLKKKDMNFYIGKFKIKCSSGTYVRGLADSLGASIQIPALAFSIKRTKIGKWSKPL